MAEEAPKSGHHAPTSTSDLLSSAKIVAEAAQSSFGKEGDKTIDKAKVAGAAEDILEAVKSYGKLDDKEGVGQYVEKAEGYLHKYHADDSTTAPAAAEPAKEEKSSGGGGGAADLVNMAKGFFK